MKSNKASIIAGVLGIALIVVLIIVVGVAVGVSETFYLILGGGVSTIIGILIWMFIIYRARNSSVSTLASRVLELRTEYSFLRKVAGVPTKFRYQDLETATDHFNVLLGKGSSASVFKGTLDDGTPVAVKRIQGVGHGEREFKAEVSAIASVQHVNLVRLFGYCCVPEGPRLLVYQFVHNGSLSTWIFPQRSTSTQNSVHVDIVRPCLAWGLRCRVAIDVAKALAYLHHDCRSRILHLDVKPENILLDENFRAVVTDFGLSKLMARDLSRVYTMARGTHGYLAPEWLLENGISEKSDVYSYGILLLEIIGGRRSVRLATEKDNTQRKWSFFPKIVTDKLKQGKLMEVVDERLLIEGGEVDERKVRILVHVALWCIQEQPKLRPSMSCVVDMLEERVKADRPPENEMSLSNLLEYNEEETNVYIRNRTGIQPTRQVDERPGSFSYSCGMSVLSGR